jgi:diaminohydroxyphosphoribosylaminopyrimidine deaminase/5-amino-6-(5-phosphoribosylamino)uracil reductase
MERTVELAAQCETEPGRPLPSPKVAAIALSPDGELLAEAYRGELNTGDHAEFCLISKLGDAELLRGATVLTTLEPCTERNHPKVPCAARLIGAGVSIVYIGMLDPDARIRELGWSALRNAGVDVRDFTSDLREKIQELNRPFVERFQVAVGPREWIKFDYTQNAGRMRIEHGGISFDTKWSMAGHGSIHAYGDDGTMAMSTTAAEFADIDDPGLFEFAGHSKHAREGQIVIFRSDAGYALVRVESVLAGPDWGDPHVEAAVSYELRLKD